MRTRTFLLPLYETPEEYWDEDGEEQPRDAQTDSDKNPNSVVVEVDDNCTSQALLDSPSLSDLKEAATYEAIISSNHSPPFNWKEDMPFRQLYSGYPPRRGRLLSYGTLRQPSVKELRGPVAVKLAKHGIVFHYTNHLTQIDVRKLRGRIRTRQCSSPPKGKGGAPIFTLSPLKCLLISFGALLLLFVWLLSEDGGHGPKDTYRIWPIFDDDEDEITAHDINDGGLLQN